MTIVTRGNRGGRRRGIIGGRRKGRGGALQRRVTI